MVPPTDEPAGMGRLPVYRQVSRVAVLLPQFQPVAEMEDTTSVRPVGMGSSTVMVAEPAGTGPALALLASFLTVRV